MDLDGLIGLTEEELIAAAYGEPEKKQGKKKATPKRKAKEEEDQKKVRHISFFVNSDNVLFEQVYENGKSAFLTFDPVSYTHLDVYKRQLSGGSFVIHPPFIFF